MTKDRTGSRTKARKRAIEVLYEADLRQTPINEQLQERLKHSAHESALPAYSVQIIEGVSQNLERINELIETYSKGWPLHRMPAVDRAVMRLGVWEVLFNDDVPDAVAVNEAVEISKELSTEESPGFINGLLGKFIELKPTLLA